MRECATGRNAVPTTVLALALLLPLSPSFRGKQDLKTSPRTVCVWCAKGTRIYLLFFLKGGITEHVLLLLYFSLKFPENKSVKIMWTQWARENFMSEVKIPPAIVAHSFGFISLLRTLDSLQTGVIKQ